MSASALRRHKMKEENPEKYEKELEKAKESYYKRKAEREQRWSLGTRTTEQEKEEYYEKARLKSRKYYAEKKRKYQRQTRTSLTRTPLPGPSECKSRKDMTELEKKIHDNLVRKQRRNSRSSQKKTADRKKEALYKRQYRAKKKNSHYFPVCQVQTTPASAPNEVFAISAQATATTSGSLTSVAVISTTATTTGPTPSTSTAVAAPSLFHNTLTATLCKTPPPKKRKLRQMCCNATSAIRNATKKKIFTEAEEAQVSASVILRRTPKKKINNINALLDNPEVQALCQKKLFEQSQTSTPKSRNRDKKVSRDAKRILLRRRVQEYRERLKNDPVKLAEYKNKYQERNKKNRQKVATDEELQRRRELNRLRVQSFRDRQKKNASHVKEQTNEETDVAAPIVTRLQRQQEEATAIARRAQWRKYKQAERQRWNSQKKRRNRERSLAWYHANKTPVKSSLSELNHTDAQIIKTNIEKEIEKLKPKRSKESLKSKKLLQNVMGGGNDQKEIASYKKKKSEANLKLSEFLEDVSINLPGKKTASKRTMAQKKILPKRVKHLRKEFEELNPSLKVSKSTFYRSIPRHILTSHKHKHHSCLCEICVSIDQKLDVLNKHMRTPIDGRDSLSELSLCSEVSLDCLKRICRNCGLSQVEGLILNQFSETDLQRIVKWQTWESSNRGNFKKPEPVQQTTSLSVLIKRLMEDLANFSLHLFVFRWQYSQFKLCRASIPTRHSLGLAVLDFSENFTCRPQDEVQSAYYGYTQITVHPSVTYYAYPVPECSEIVIEYLVFLSDDLHHDAAMAQTVLDKTVQHLKLRVPDLEQLAVFSDGCAAQYKSKLPFFYLSDMRSPVEIVRAYFGSRHGKRPCDACGDVIKRAVEQDVLSRQVAIKDAKTISSFNTEESESNDDAPSEKGCPKNLNEAFIETVQSPVNHNCGDMPISRVAYFTHLQEQFSACASYTDLCKVVSDTSTSILLYELPPIHPRCLYDVGTVDHNSLKYLPKGIELVYPVATEADGNCVPRSFSLLLFGDQEHHIEIRCRIVHELVTNSAEYLSLGDVEILCQLSDFYGRETDEIFQLETLEVSRPCSFMGMWQIIAAANVFQAPVLSVYPTLADSQEPDFYKLFFDRTVVPRNPITNQTLVILWTSTREDVSMTHWAANHVVPLMPLTNCEEILIT
ncbi:vertnin [Plakobranchus ocellatus]|uniref:Vertnin n=1 Tax=Plakobranchus ocellatus TaxID=259542 RepID=A0AAV3XWL1_9GAST|nr:vertnin [Plakobranchus ocellatus]